MAGERNGNSEQRSITSAPVSVPVGQAGVDLREGAASRSPVALKELLNGVFVHDRALGKRNGHTAAPMISYDSYPQVDTEEVRPWLYGWGDLTYQGYNGAAVKPPYMPRQTQGKGVAVLDDSLVGWTGDRLLLNREGKEQWLDSRGIPAFLPTGTEDRWHLGTSMPEFADTAVSATNQVLVHERNSHFYVSVRDRETGAWILRDVELSTGGSVITGSVVYSNGYFVAMWCNAAQLFYSWSRDTDPGVWSAAASWANCNGGFDMEVISDNDFLVAWRDGGSIKIAYWHGITQSNAPAAPGTVLATGANTPSGVVGVCYGRDATIGLVWGSAGGTFAGAYTNGGATMVNNISVDANNCQRATIAGHWNYDGASHPQFSVFADITALPTTTLTVGKQFNTIGTTSSLTSRPHSFVASRAFRVGDNVMVVLKSIQGSATVQSLHYLLCQPVVTNGEQAVIGAWTRGESAFGFELNLRVTGVRPEPGQSFGSPDYPSTPRWVFSVIRSNSGFVLTEWQPTCISLDFLPPFRAAQFGRCLYFAGSAVQLFDGRQVHEAGFLEYPQVTQVASSATGGALTPGAVRQYRVYARHRNTQGEIAMSPALTFQAPAVGVGHNNNVITFTTIAATSRSDVTFDIYGTDTSLAVGSAFYLISSGVVANSFTSNTVTYTDTYSDASLRVQPTDPHAVLVGSLAELEETAPPGCTLIAAAKERLWFAGGSLLRGRVAFSKLREGTEVAGWDDTAGYGDLDSSGREITSLAGFGDAMIIMQPDAIWAVPGDGPSNLGVGSFPGPQLIVPGTGSIIHEGTGLSEVGLLFWADSGPRLLTRGFSVEDISQEVEPLARELGLLVTGCVVNNQSREVRWYTSEGRALMWDYSMRGQYGNRWAVWFPLAAAGAIYYPRIRGAAIVQPDGMVLLEDPSADTDGGNHYEFAFTTGDLRPTELLQGDNRFKWLSVAGENKGDHILNVWTYYDGSPWWNDHFTWDPTGALAIQEWGGGTGTYPTDPTFWVDPSKQSPDGVYRFRRRLPRDKGALISFRFSDAGAPNDSFIINEIALELAAEQGLTNTPPRTFSGVETE